MRRSVTSAVTGILVAIGILYLVQLLVSHDKSERNFLSIRSAEWHYKVNEQNLVRPLTLGTSLASANHDLVDCCHGTYKFTIDRSQIDQLFQDGLLKAGDRLGLYISAIGGNFSLKVNGELYAYSGFNPATIGPLIPISLSDLSQKSGLEVAITINGPRSGYTGIWRNPAQLGSFDSLDYKRQKDLLHYVITPLFFVAISMILILLFAYLYLFTDKQFPSYGLFSLSLIPIAIFQFILSGYPRKVDEWLATVLHYPAALFEGVGILILLTCFLAHVREEVDLHQVKQRVWFKQIAAVLVLGALVLLAIGASGVWAGQGIAASLIYILSFSPVLFWPLKNMSIRSLNFVGFAVVATGAIGTSLDLIKNMARDFGMSMPYEYFARITTPLMVGTTVLVSATHFRRFFLNHQKSLAAAARDAAIARTIQMLAHDVRRPFSLLKNALLLIDHKLQQPEVKATVRSVRNQVNEALQSVNVMLEDLMSFGPEPRLTCERVKPETLITEALSVLPRNLMSTRHVDYVYHHELLLNVDKSKMIRVFANILENALQATPVNGQITIKIDDVPAAKALILSVTNTGSFIPPEDRTRIFEFFFTKGKLKGTGLGLAVAKHIVEAHGGVIECNSSVEHGTTFSLRLPAVEENLNATSQNSHAVMGAESDHLAVALVVVVDDDPLVLETSMQVFAPFKVQTFASPAEFWEAFHRRELDHIFSVVTDFVFTPSSEEDSGLTFAKELKLLKPELPIFLRSNFELSAAEASIFAAQFPKNSSPIEELHRALKITWDKRRVI